MSIIKKALNTTCLFLISINVVLFSNCTNDKPEPGSNIILRWPQAYPTEDWNKVLTGLNWSLSFIGAQLPKGSASMVFKRDGNDRIIFDPSKAGLNDESLKKIGYIFQALKESEEYRKQGSADLGRFLLTSIYSSWNYYALTGAERSLTDFKKKYQTGIELKYAATNSTVAKHDRVITLGISPDISKMYFLAEEGNGTVSDGTFTPTEFEVISFMTNGQPRFAIYDEAGNLKDAGDTSLTIAGKPGKCMWCHESDILPVFKNNLNIAGYLTQEEFIQNVQLARSYLETYRKNINTEINYLNSNDHAFSELLYTSFMEPSVYRLSREWNIEEEEVRKILAALSTHINNEVPIIGDVFDRLSVEKFAPYQSIAIPFSVREKSGFEPDYFSFHP